MHHHHHILRERPVAGLAAIALSILAVPAGAQVGLGLTPMRVEFAATAGRAVSGALSLSNGSDAKTRIRTEILDLYVDENSTPQFVENAAAEAPFSCRTWLSVNPMEMEVEPHSRVSIRYTVRVPDTAKERGYHCALGFRTLPAETEETGTAMRFAVRMIAALYPTVGKPTIAGSIAGLKLEPVQGGPDSARLAIVTMENSGMALYRPTGSVEIVEAGGKLVESVGMATVPMLPQRKQRYVMPLKSALAPGAYTLRARVDVGHEIQEASAQVTVEAAVPPPVPAESPKK